MAEHYFTNSPSGEFTRREIQVTLAGSDHTVFTSGGVFSPEQLDRGTEVLLKSLDREGAAETSNEQPKEPHRILDLGCGWGAIALSASLRAPEAEVWAIDINERARDLAAQNASRLGLTKVRVCAPDEVPSDIQFAEIHSNPPVRVGKDAMRAMLRFWLGRLRVGGSATLVIAKHLGAESLQRWLASEFEELDVQRVFRDKGFHVIRAVRTRPSELSQQG